ALKRAIQDGAPFDLAILPRPELDDLIASGAIVRDSVVNVARSTVGLAVRAGAPQPDIGSVEALRRTLMAACSIAYSDGPSGAYVAGLLGKLGIAAAVAAKIKLTSGPVAELVARGEAELGMQQIVAILPVAGEQLVGPLPAELQNVIIYCRRAVVAWCGFHGLFCAANKQNSLRAPMAWSPANRRKCSVLCRSTRSLRAAGEAAEIPAPSRFYDHTDCT